MQPLNHKAIVIYCGLLLSITAFSIDIMLQAFSVMSVDLETDYAAVQFVIPIFLICTGLGQIVMGPLSDRFGRKPIIMFGLAIYCFGAFICFAAGSIEAMLAGRAFQGLGASVGPVLGRAVLRDLFQGKALASNLALATMIFAFGPIAAPLLGILIMELGSWRLIFFVIAMFGAILLAWGVWKLPETNLQKDILATRLSSFGKKFRALVSNDQSRFYLLMAGPIMSLMIVILISVPRVYNVSFGIDGPLFALLFAFHGTGIIVGQIINRKIIAKSGVQYAMRTGSIIVFVTVVLMLVLYMLGMLGPYVMSTVLALFATGYLMIMSNATAMALDPHGTIAGFVSSFFGFTSQFFSSIIGILIGLWIGGDLSSFISALLVISGLVMAILFIHRMLQPSQHTVEGKS